MDNVTLLSAFVIGLLTFFAPCTFVALPTFISYLALRATDVEVLSKPKQRRFSLRILLSALSYAAGFLLVFTVLGLTASEVGRFLNTNRDLYARFGGMLIILFGLFILFGEHISKVRFLFREKRVYVKPHFTEAGYLFPFVIGLTSAFSWTPCIGPILGSIFLLAGRTSSTAASGALLLFMYGLGIMLPFIGIALVFGSAEKIVARLKKYTGFIHKLTAVILIFMGILLFTGLFNQLFGVVYRVFIGLGYSPR